MHRDGHRPLAHGGAVTGQVQRPCARCRTGQRNTETDGADRFVGGSATRAGDPAGRHGDVDSEATDRALGHRRGDRLAHGAVFDDQFGWDVEHSGLGLVGVRDDPAHHIVRGPGAVGEARRDHAAGARLGRGDAAALQRRGDEIVDGGTVDRKDLCPMMFEQPFGQGVVGGLGVDRIAGHDLHLTSAQAGGDLQLVGAVDPGLDGAQGGGQVGLREPEGANGLFAEVAASGDRRGDRFGTDRRVPHALQLTRRARKDEDRRCAECVLGDRGYRDSWRGADRRDRLRPLRNHRLLACAGLRRLRRGLAALLLPA